MPEHFDTTDCATAMEGIEAYVDGELAGAAALEAHLESCEACAAEHRLATAVRRELRALPELDAPPAVLRSVRLQAGGSRFARPYAWVRKPAWAALAAAVFAAVLAAVLWPGWLRQAPPEAPPAADPAAVTQATAEARFALAYMARVSRRAGLKLKDDVMIERLARPAARSLARSLFPDLETAPPLETKGAGPRDGAAERNRS